jgi:hypothetical protein
LTVLPGEGGGSLFGAYDLVMIYGEVPLDEELLVIGIEDSRADVLSGARLVSGPGLPQAHRDELSPVTLGPPE